VTLRLSHVAIAASLLVAGWPAAACQSLPMVFFPYGSSVPHPEGAAALASFAQQASTRLDDVEQIRIVGHADRTGSRSSRQRIAERRAASVRDVLIGLGIPERLLVASGAADRQPLYETEDNVREPTNRRVELRLVMSKTGLANAAAQRAAALAKGEPIPLC
jgi:outer membrane protein OmpA-like peptidoglycan-associated protein